MRHTLKKYLSSSPKRKVKKYKKISPIVKWESRKPKDTYIEEEYIVNKMKLWPWPNHGKVHRAETSCPPKNMYCFKKQDINEENNKVVIQTMVLLKIRITRIATIVIANLYWELVVS